MNETDACGARRVDAVRFGIQTLAPQFFGSAPDFVVSGPNVGSAHALSIPHSLADLLHS